MFCLYLFFILIGSPRAKTTLASSIYILIPVHKCSIKTCHVKMCPADLAIMIIGHFYTFCTTL